MTSFMCARRKPYPINSSRAPGQGSRSSISSKYLFSTP
jgi:hypothetical protein